MENQAKKPVHISWENARRAEAERDKARQATCKPIPPGRIKLITIHLSRDFSKLRTSVRRLWKVILDHGLRTSGSRRKNLFSPETVQRITAYSKELRGLVDTMSDKALLAAYSAKSAVSGKMVKEEKPTDNFRLGVETSTETDVRAVNYQSLKNQGKVGAEEARRGKAAVAIGLATILLAGLGALSYAPWSKHLAQKRGAIAQPERRDTADLKAMAEGPKAQLAALQLASINHIRVQPEGRDSSAESAPGSLGSFKIVDDSFVRDNPEANAAIIATLRPGTQVEVESETGEYFRVRSLNEPQVIGYMHKEDAFFQAH
jgi:hypothetical protein